MNHYVQLHDQLADLVRSSAALIAPKIMTWLKPRSVIDVGCGNGTWLAALRQHGAERILGLDGDYISSEALEIPESCFQAWDLTQPLPTLERFELAICLEVAEHLPEQIALRLIQDLTKVAPVVVFSAAIPGQGGVDHINEQWQSYWVQQFQHNGYLALDPLRLSLWTEEKVAYWYAQNMLLFCDSAELERLPTKIRTPAMMPWDVVHPKRMISLNRELNFYRNPGIKSSLKQLAGCFRKRITGK